MHQDPGPALGIYQCVPATHRLVLRWTMEHEPTALISYTALDDRLIYHLYYATQIARLLYRSIPQSLPEADPAATWHYYKHYYNRGGKATQREWNANWAEFVTPVLEAQL